MKDIIFYYSNSGNNAYLAQKTAKDIGADIEEVKPVSASLFPLIFSTLTGFPCAVKKTNADITQYSRVILCTPIWMGNMPAPMRSFIRKNRKHLKNVHLVTCCGGGESEKDGKFGTNSFFKKAALIMPDAQLQCTSLSLEMIIPPELKGNSEAMMKIRLNNETSTPAFESAYEAMIGQLKA